MEAEVSTGSSVRQEGPVFKLGNHSSGTTPSRRRRPIHPNAPAGFAFPEHEPRARTRPFGPLRHQGNPSRRRSPEYTGASIGRPDRESATFGHAASPSGELCRVAFDLRLASRLGNPGTAGPCRSPASGPRSLRGFPRCLRSRGERCPNTNHEHDSRPPGAPSTENVPSARPSDGGRPGPGPRAPGWGSSPGTRRLPGCESRRPKCWKGPGDRRRPAFSVPSSRETG